MNTSLKVYFARSISGREVGEVIRYYDYIVRRFSLLGVQVYHPMVGKEKLRCDKKFKAHGYKGIPCSTNHGIAERDLWMVSQADIIYTDLMDTHEVSIGCVGELAVAHWLRKHTIVSMESGNIHEHAFLLEFADVRYYTHLEAVQYIEDLVNSTSGWISPEFKEYLKGERND